MFLPTPAGLRAPDHYSAAAWPLVCEQQRLPRWVFRRSIAWLSDSLSTLRRVGYPTTTQDSLPAAGQALPDGLSTRRIPTKGFRFASYISSSFPKLLVAITSTQGESSARSVTSMRARWVAAVTGPDSKRRHSKNCRRAVRPGRARTLQGNGLGVRPVRARPQPRFGLAETAPVGIFSGDRCQTFGVSDSGQ
jgi:hypothetical protein